VRNYNGSVSNAVSAIKRALKWKSSRLYPRQQQQLGTHLSRSAQSQRLVICVDWARRLFLLTEAFATIHCQDIDAVRSNFFPHNAKNPKETYTPTPINSINSYGEGEEPSTLRETLFDKDAWVEYVELQSRVKALCESFASKECVTAPHLASSLQHLDAIQTKLEATSKP